MSEQAPQPTINPQAQAAFEYEHIYPAEQLKQRGQQQVEQHIYDENRPYQDTEGNAHDPVNGQFANIDAYFDKQREIAEDSSQNPYEAMSMTQLARKLGEAEFHNDKTSAINIGDVLMDKLSEYESKVVDGHDASQKTGERHDTGHNNTFSDNMWDRVMGVKDKEIASLTERSQAKPAIAEPEAKKDAPEADQDPKIATNPAEAKEALENEPGMRVFSYKPNAEGMVDMAVSFDAEGIGVDLAELTDLDDKNLIFATEEDEDYAPLTFYVADGEVYNLTHMDLYKNDKGGWSVSDMAEKSSITIGEPIMVDGKQVSGPVKRIMIEMPTEHKDQLEESWEAQDKRSPFRIAEDLIDSIENTTEVAAPAIEDDYVLMKDRPKKIMGWAAKQLKRLKNAPLAAGTHVSNKLHNTSERFSKQEKGRRRTIIGATAGAILLAGAAYLDLKGHGTGNTQELVNSPKGTIPNPLEGVNLASATDKHQVIRDIADVTPRGGHGAAVVDHVKTVTVHGNSGDTLWNEATQKLHRQGIVNPTNKQINVATLRLEHLNGISPEQAHFLASEGDEVIKV